MTTDPDRDRPRVFVAVPFRPGTSHQAPVTDNALREAEDVLALADARLIVTGTVR